MSISGGITTNKNEIEMTITMSGGKSYKRVYNDVVSLGIDKFVLISSFLSKILNSKSDTNFYVDQAKQLFQRGHVGIISGNKPYHNRYNMWLLDGYVRMLLETCDMKLIAQLLDLDSILYSIEEADDTCNEIDFEVPKNLKIKTLQSIEQSVRISTPISDELSAYLYSFSHNLALLVKLIISNKEALNAIYKQIIEQAKKKFK